MEVVRSDYSRYTRKMMDDVVKTILRSEDVNEIAILIDSYISKFKKYVRNHDTIIGRPCSWGMKEYKTLTIGVRAMSIYNRLIRKHFRSGDRGYLYDISSVNFKKLGFKDPSDILSSLISEGLIKKNIDVIAIPEGEVLDKECFEIDIDKMMENSISNRLEFISDVLGITIEDM